MTAVRRRRRQMGQRDSSDPERESAALASNPRFAALIEASRRSYREEGGIGIDDVRRELGLEAPPRQTGTQVPVAGGETSSAEGQPEEADSTAARSEGRER